MKTRIPLFLLCALLFSIASAQKPEAIVIKASVSPVIGGEIDAVWSEANIYNISYPYRTETPTLGNEGETTWRALWTYEGIYVLTEVTDDAFYPTWADTPPGLNEWEYDKPELFFDCNNILEDGEGANQLSEGNKGHYHFAPGMAENSLDGTPQAEDWGGFAFMVEVPNYWAEYFISWDHLRDKDGNKVDGTGQIGFDVTVIDRDPNDEFRRRAVWANTGEIAESWGNMDDCGIITLHSYVPPPKIESIILSGGEISTNNGSLQVEAQILPENAADTSLAWSVENITGKASISEAGLVTAIADGSVTVKALANDGSGVEAVTEVTISNQDVSINELSLIRNGNFDRVDENGFPEEWIQLSAMEDKAPFVEDGYLVLDPAQGLNNFYEFQFGQQGFACNTTSEYMFSFLAWADEKRTFQVDFEDPANSWLRYGTSDHEYAFMGESEWLFEVSTEPTLYNFYVVFDKKLETTTESLMFQLGLSGVVTYIDSVQLIDLDDLPLLSTFNPLTSIIVSSEGDATTMKKGETLKMSADLLPVDATLADFRWSILPGTGGATIDKNGVLTGTKGGTSTVIATARDGSKITGEFEIEIIQEVTSITVRGEDNASTVEKQATLQMSARILPEDASFTEVNWGIVPGTGEASIDENGLLFGIEAGTVNVMAFARDQSGISGSLSIEVTTPVGIDQQKVYTLSLYPNPATELLTLTLPAGTERIEIYNSLGTLVDDLIVKGTRHQIDVSSYSPGIYTLKAGKQAVKFMK